MVFYCSVVGWLVEPWQNCVLLHSSYPMNIKGEGGIFSWRVLLPGFKLRFFDKVGGVSHQRRGVGAAKRTSKQTHCHCLFQKAKATFGPSLLRESTRIHRSG